MIGLCDCNSFYASCERLFRPDLRTTAVVVLSNNDGCIVALSSEAKKLGIKRGAPLFEERERLDSIGAAIFSSNYTLYQDLSDRVMDTLLTLVGNREVYSIDEAFFSLENPTQEQVETIRNEIIRLTGIPVSIGVARTKTLSKLANHEGKRQPSGVRILYPEDEQSLLKQTAIGEVWGIGRRREAQLVQRGVRTAHDFISKDDLWIEKHCTITGLQTARELRGVRCIPKEVEKSISLCSGISFEKPKESLEELEQSIACHCATLASKLTKRGKQAREVTVALYTSRFREDYQSPSATVTLAQGSAYTPTLLAAAKVCLASIYRKAPYKASRVWVTYLEAEGVHQYSLFNTEWEQKRIGQEEKLSPVVQEIQRAYGRRALVCGTAGSMIKGDLMGQAYLSPCYTTDWKALPTVH
ncbi:MAG TPA: DUF4113 domain-containing protein [Sphaerochaeta sp.]|nr:DUF4113 domain-containing protein [Sphaerochaeta sp.]